MQLSGAARALAPDDASQTGVLPSIGGVLADLSAIAERLKSLPWWSQPHAEVCDAVIQLGSVIAQLEATRLCAIREVDTRGLAIEAGATCTAAWLRWRARIERGEAHALVRLAGELSTSRNCAPALSNGEISLSHVRTISTALRQLPEEATVDDLERAEEFLVEAARHHEPRTVARQGRMIASVLDSEGSEPLEESERRQRNHRELVLGQGRDGMVHLHGRLDAQTGLLLRDMLDPLAAPRPSVEGPDRRGPGQRLGDAFAELLDVAARTSDLSSPRGGPFRVNVTMDLGTLLGAAGCLPGMSDHGEPLSAAAARRLACDAGVLPTVLDGAGCPLDVGRTRRTVPAALFRALVVRDGGCAFPSCDRPPSWCDAHHVVFWSQGGRTALDNLVLLCGRHHTVVHHEGWTVHIAGDGLPVFRPPRWVDPDQPLLPASRALLRRTLAQLNPAPPEPPWRSAKVCEPGGASAPGGPGAPGGAGEPGAPGEPGWAGEPGAPGATWGHDPQSTPNPRVRPPPR